MAYDLNVVLYELARRYADLALELLGDRLTSVALYGSVARGQAGPASDIDLFIVLREAPRGALRRRALLEPVREQLTADLEPLWDQGIYTDFVEVIRSEEEARHFHPLYLDMTLEAELLYDRDGFLARVLDGVRQRLEVLGAQRLSLGRIHYWDLKPTLRPGEAIEL
ncbi:MAG: nucleotidyltransferase domain-containing protein [Chloroflexi bacterium]|nr:MAG: nucleotidyltransferase domain-containing protein [Chloroflexota bacterium]